MTWIVVDVEADGPAPGLYSMINFAAVVLPKHETGWVTFKGLTRPISPDYISNVLAISGVTRDEHALYPDPAETMPAFVRWIKQVTRPGDQPVFVSDNNGYDWQWINYYLWRFAGENPFGHSSRRIGDLYGGFLRDATKGGKFKKLRQTRHTHDPVDDAIGNAEALVEMHRQGLKMPFMWRAP